MDTEQAKIEEDFQRWVDAHTVWAYDGRRWEEVTDPDVREVFFAADWGALGYRLETHLGSLDAVGVMYAFVFRRHQPVAEGATLPLYVVSLNTGMNHNTIFCPDLPALLKLLHQIASPIAVSAMTAALGSEEFKRIASGSFAADEEPSQEKPTPKERARKTVD
jgi:hypothetical protein